MVWAAANDIFCDGIRFGLCHNIKSFIYQMMVCSDRNYRDNRCVRWKIGFINYFGAPELNRVKIVYGLIG